MSGLDDWLMEDDVPEPIKKIWPAATRIPTTDEMDQTTPEERNALVAYCEHCEEWWKFTRGTDPETCPTCGGKYSTRIGYQLISQRSFNPATKRAKIKR